MLGMTTKKPERKARGRILSRDSPQTEGQRFWASTNRGGERLKGRVVESLHGAQGSGIRHAPFSLAVDCVKRVISREIGSIQFDSELLAVDTMDPSQSRAGGGAGLALGVPVGKSGEGG